MSDKKTWFGFWREDGFTRTKHKGRIDQDHLWSGIRDEWVEAFRNREVTPGHSVTKKVTHSDEWLAEAYLETDYGSISRADFQSVVRDYAVFQLVNSLESDELVE